MNCLEVMEDIRLEFLKIERFLSQHLEDLKILVKIIGGSITLEISLKTLT